MTNLSDLPEEVLELVLSWLELCQIKVAAQVCRLWNRLAFGPRRFCLSPPLVFMFTPEERQILLNSERSFYRLRIFLCEKEPLRDKDIATLVQVVAKHGTRMISMQIISQELSLDILLKLLQSAPNLKKLFYVGNLLWDLSDEAKLPVFRNVRNLHVQEDVKCKIKERNIVSEIFPNLSSMRFGIAGDVAIDLLAVYGKQLKSLFATFDTRLVKNFSDLDYLENLESVSFSWYENSRNDNVSFKCFQKMKQIKVADIHFKIRCKTFDLICSNWKQLQSLLVEVERLDAATFSKISSLGHLKKLGLSGCITDCALLKGIHLPRVESLSVYRCPTPEKVYCHLPNFVPNLRSLNITEDYSNSDFDNSYLELISRTMPTLEKIELNNCIKIEDISFTHLEKLTRLTELYVCSFDSSRGTSLTLDSLRQLNTVRNSNLRVFGMDYVPVPKCLSEISKAFPNLRTMDIMLFEVEQDTVLELQELHPNLVISKRERIF